MKVKKYYKIALFFAKLTVICGLIKFIFFQLLEGWHWEITNSVEKWCGDGVNALALSALISFMLATSELIEEYIKHYEGKE